MCNSYSVEVQPKALLNYSKRQCADKLEPHTVVFSISNQGKLRHCATMPLHPFAVVAKLQEAKQRLAGVMEVSIMMLDFSTIVLRVQQRDRNAPNQLGVNAESEHDDE